MRQTWARAVHSLRTGLLALSKVTFGKPAFAIVLIAFLHQVVYFPFKIRAARQMKQNAEKLKELAPAIKEIEEKYKGEPGQRLNATDVSRKGKEIQQLQKEAGINFTAGCLTAMVPVLSEAVIKQAIAGIAKDERFQNGGILWFKDLTKPERFYVLTGSLIGISYLELKEIQRRVEQVNLVRNSRIRNFANWLPLLALGLTLITRKQPPSGEVIYSIASTGFSLAGDFYIRKVITGTQAE